ncbi:hypothetical protein OG909_16985 [Streptomyces sp. NBC_01754]|uniref:hypothetical protein n=1 Tax=Streptomyces sp. NBC_01754 TaxID=2975930 RepID=UPI002DD866F6|nr:hypothetical protein [Streptomyces sp. NBC_01754]WSC93830.1 hypothetical protein OG909_16985 [Streptomyces sp. NBC_01754]
MRRRPGRGPRRELANKLLCVLAVAGTGLSLWAFTLEFTDHRDRAESRTHITEACGGLVDPDRILGLDGGGIGPAVHVMRLADPYDRVVGDRLEALLRAYVDDATGRRGCTGVLLPGAADFARG